MAPTSPAPAALTPGLDARRAIRIKRAALHLSQRELSRRAGLSPGYVGLLESSRLHPSLRGFARLAVELRLTPMEMSLIVATEASMEES